MSAAEENLNDCLATTAVANQNENPFKTEFLAELREIKATFFKQLFKCGFWLQL